MKYTARVIPGRGEGRKLGFPTLNLEIPEDFEAEQGIYAGWAWIDDEKLPAAIHYGPVPTFGSDKISLEAHVIGKEIATSPQELNLELVKHLRPVRNFETLEGLTEQMREDVRQALEILKRV